MVPCYRNKQDETGEMQALASQSRERIFIIFQQQGTLIVLPPLEIFALVALKYFHCSIL